MASHGGHGTGRLVDWLAEAGATYGRLLVLSVEQPALGNLGLARRSLGADYSAGVPGSDEYSWRKEE